MSQKEKQPMNLYDIWEHHYASNFAKGVELLQRHTPRAVTTTIMRRLQEVVFTSATPSEYELGKLTDALSRTAIPEHVSDSDTALVFVTGIKPEPPGVVVTHTEKTNLPKTTTHAKSLHKQHGHVHAQMALAHTDKERGDHAKNIMENIVPELDAEYAKLRGEGAEDPVSETKVTNTLRQLNSVRTRIARLRNHLIPKEKNKARLAILEAELVEKIAIKEKLEAELA